MSFKYIKDIDFITSLANKLGNTSQIFWPNEELKSIRTEILQSLGSLGFFFKDDVNFQTVENQVFYDIFDIAKNGNNEFSLKPSVTVKNIIDDILRVLMLDNIDLDIDIYEFIKRRINQYLLETGVIVEELEIDYDSVGGSYISIPSYVMDIIRMVFIDSNNKVYTLRLSDENTLRGFYGNYRTNIGSSLFYTNNVDNKLKIYPAPAQSGKLHLLVIKSIDKDTVLANESIINLPNNLTQYIKYGVLADIYNTNNILSNSSIKEYCEKRWQEGVIVGQNYATIINAEINGVPTNTSSIEDMDSYFPKWQNEVKGKPNLLLSVSNNLLATDKKPNLNNEDNYSILLNVVRNAIIPTKDDDYIQVNSEYIEDLLNFGVHLASIKRGVSEIQNTLGYYQSFVRLVKLHNSRLATKYNDLEAIFNKSRIQDTEKPRFDKEKTNA